MGAAGVDRLAARPGQAGGRDRHGASGGWLSRLGDHRGGARDSSLPVARPAPSADDGTDGADGPMATAEGIRVAEEPVEEGRHRPKGPPRRWRSAGVSTISSIA
eukprot:2969113-Pyramimonas_sp.AAC.1